MRFLAHQSRFNKLKKQLAGYHPDYVTLPEAEKNLLHALIDFYKSLSMHRHLLMRLTNLGGEFQSIEQASSSEEMAAQTRLNQADDREHNWSRRLLQGLKEL